MLATFCTESMLAGSMNWPGKYRELQPGTDGLNRSRVFRGQWLNAEALWKCGFSALSATVQQGTATAEYAVFVSCRNGSSK